MRPVLAARGRATVRVAGRVSRGLGRAAADLRAAAGELEQILGFSPFPGTLNVVLRRPFRLSDERAKRFDGGGRLLWPGALNGRKVWLYRWSHAPLHVVEVVSPHDLRAELSLRDGDVVTVEVATADLARVDGVGTIVWTAVWLGRRGWCYTNRRYYHRTLKWCRRHGATQEIPS